ncbi:MAG TPA: phospho-N-acetylmuramoyl-pentapeptide-transferase [Candidatus Saccharibacteria bacterium]|nr:phospho-N-acetylmuramoyl-pentapeptide-transferase [Candidatus Saccharibacteria bacterium]HRK94396.1 phospho-N-acetylmuramoyl-pentapeptide-transferase [Candidatus Saccharibacteria bacterium]
MNTQSIIDAITSNTTGLFFMSAGAFLLAMALTPLYTHFAYRYKFWKKQRSVSTSGEVLEVFTKLHAAKFLRNIPTMAGVIGVVTIAVITFAFNLDRSQTWLPLAALLGGAVVGLIDDIINLRSNGHGVAGLRSSIKFMMIVGIGTALGWYFFAKIGIDAVHVPFAGSIAIGWLIIPLFAFVVTATANAVNISDGLDGLAGGLLAMSFAAFGAIALLQGQIMLAGFCFTAIGALLSYLWFNIHPARFFMGDVGSFAYGVALGVVAILTDSLLLLPVIGLLFVIEAGSSLIQIAARRFFGRKIFLSAPIHHHLEAIGWPETKVTMRFWLIGCVTASLGVLLALAGGHIL